MRKKPNIYEKEKVSNFEISPIESLTKIIRGISKRIAIIGASILMVFDFFISKKEIIPERLRIGKV